MGCDLIKYFKKNELGKDYFVGDIHGEFHLLKRKLLELNFNEAADRLFSVGDLVDRGTDSLQSIQWIRLPYFHAVQGNHENMAIRYPNGNMDMGNYLRNGGGWMISLGSSQAREVSEALKTLPLMLEIETEQGLVGVVHAEVTGDDWEHCKKSIQRKEVQQTVMWNRDRISFRDKTNVKGIDYVIVGHTPLQKPARLGNVFYIDTGAVFGRELTVTTLERLIEKVKQ